MTHFAHSTLQGRPFLHPDDQSFAGVHGVLNEEFSVMDAARTEE